MPSLRKSFWVCLKTTETLLGIETLTVEYSRRVRMKSQNYWNPFRDWNTARVDARNSLICLKTTETLLGIETRNFSSAPIQLIGLKTTETLLGIETRLKCLMLLILESQNYWNPFRDWNIL